MSDMDNCQNLFVLKCTLHNTGHLALIILFLPNTIEGGHRLLDLLLLLAAHRDGKKSSESGSSSSESEGEEAPIRYL